MKFLALAILAALSAITEAAAVVEAREAKALLEGYQLEKRSCQDNGCRCWDGQKGLQCGYCIYKRGPGGSKGDVFQCGDKSCCHYGPRDDCQANHGPCTGPFGWP